MPTWLIIILINLVVTLILGFALYIWRNQEGRVKALEIKNGINITKQMDHPFLRIEDHQLICRGQMDHMKSTVETQTSLLIHTIGESEKRTQLLIENAILKLMGKRE